MRTSTVGPSFTGFICSGLHVTRGKTEKETLSQVSRGEGGACNNLKLPTQALPAILFFEPSQYLRSWEEPYEAEASRTVLKPSLSSQQWGLGTDMMIGLGRAAYYNL